ncbi:MAG: TolC family protein [Nitrospirota bacterium]
MGGGRLDRGIKIAGLKKSIAEDSLRVSRQELIFNLTNVYYKILQLEKLLQANEAAVKQLERHETDDESFYKAAPRHMSNS